MFFIYHRPGQNWLPAAVYGVMLSAQTMTSAQELAEDHFDLWDSEGRWVTNGTGKIARWVEEGIPEYTIMFKEV